MAGDQIKNVPRINRVMNPKLTGIAIINLSNKEHKNHLYPSLEIILLKARNFVVTHEELSNKDIADDVAKDEIQEKEIKAGEFSSIVDYIKYIRKYCHEKR